MHKLIINSQTAMELPNPDAGTQFASLAVLVKQVVDLLDQT